jgi:hypothetical protein
MPVLDLTTEELNVLETLVDRAIGKGMMNDVEGAPVILDQISDKIMEA